MALFYGESSLFFWVGAAFSRENNDGYFLWILSEISVWKRRLKKNGVLVFLFGVSKVGFFISALFLFGSKSVVDEK